MILKADRPKFLILTLGPCQVSCGTGEKVIYFQGSGEQALTFGDLGSRGNGQLEKQYSLREQAVKRPTGYDLTQMIRDTQLTQGHGPYFFFVFLFAQFTMISVQDLYFRIDHSETREAVLFHTNLRRSVRQRCTVPLTERNHVTSY